MYNPPIVPDDFVVPEVLVAERMTLRPLTLGDAEKDYEAVISSAHRLQTVFRENGEWPEGLTLHQNRIELGWHQTEFQLRTSFAYTVMAPDESRTLGCMYIYPCFKGDHDVEISMWVRESEAGSGLDEHLYQTVKNWIAQSWPFRNPVYPGRSIRWQDWYSL